MNHIGGSGGKDDEVIQPQTTTKIGGTRKNKLRGLKVQVVLADKETTLNNSNETSGGADATNANNSVVAKLDSWKQFFDLEEL